MKTRIALVFLVVAALACSCSTSKMTADETKPAVEEVVAVVVPEPVSQPEAEPAVQQEPVIVDVHEFVAQPAPSYEFYINGTRFLFERNGNEVVVTYLGTGEDIEYLKDYMAFVMSSYGYMFEGLEYAITDSGAVFVVPETWDSSQSMLFNQILENSVVFFPYENSPKVVVVSEPAEPAREDALNGITETVVDFDNVYSMEDLILSYETPQTETDPQGSWTFITEPSVSWIETVSEQEQEKKAVAAEKAAEEYVAAQAAKAEAETAAKPATAPVPTQPKAEKKTSNNNVIIILIICAVVVCCACVVLIRKKKHSAGKPENGASGVSDVHEIPENPETAETPEKDGEEDK